MYKLDDVVSYLEEMAFMPYCPKCKDEFREGFTACNKVVPVENRPDGVETANASTRFSATGGADLKRNDYICETPLVDALHTEDMLDTHKKPDEPDFVMVDDVPALLCNASNNIEASMIESLLRSYNIPVMKRWRYGGDIVMIYTGASFTGVDLYVPSKLLENAKALLLTEPIPTETTDEDEEFLAYAKQHELEKRIKMQKILVFFVIIPIVIALLAFIWVIFIS